MIHYVLNRWLPQTTSNDFQQPGDFMSPAVTDCCWQSSTDTVSIFIGYGFAQFLVMENSVEKEGTPCVLLL